MSLSDLASLGSFVSGVAVLISLIYLALQVRQAEKNQKALMQQGRADRICDLLLRTAEPGLAAIYRRGADGEDLTSVEFTQYYNIFRAQMASRYDTFLHHQERLISEHAFKNFELSMRDLVGNQGARALWRVVRPLYPASFVSYVDKAIQVTPVVEAEHARSQWRAAIAAAEQAAA